MIMACFYANVFCFSTMLLVLQSWLANANDFPPIMDNIACGMMQCGKGTCQPSKNSTLGFVCQCHDGWKQADIPEFHETLNFLPCLIPNCTLNSTCLKHDFTFPPPSTTNPPTTSTFNPCHWTDCGGGTCNRTSLFQYRCECEQGYQNMFKIPAFPCYKQCVFQDDCSPLGLNATQAFVSSAATTLPQGDAKFLIFKAVSVLGMMLMVML